MIAKSAHRTTLFMSTCPKCMEPRSQCSYGREGLWRLLHRGHPVEAYCESCDEYWPITREERTRLSAAVVSFGRERMEWLSLLMC